MLDERNCTEVGNTSRQVLVEDTQKVQGESFSLDQVESRLPVSSDLLDLLQFLPRYKMNVMRVGATFPRVPGSRDDAAERLKDSKVVA